MLAHLLALEWLGWLCIWHQRSRDPDTQRRHALTCRSTDRPEKKPKRQGFTQRDTDKNHSSFISSLGLSLRLLPAATIQSSYLSVSLTCVFIRSLVCYQSLMCQRACFSGSARAERIPAAWSRRTPNLFFPNRLSSSIARFWAGYTRDILESTSCCGCRSARLSRRSCKLLHLCLLAQIAFGRPRQCAIGSTFSIGAGHA